MDFRILVPAMGSQETALLTSFIEVGQKQVLEHPLCETFLLLKWRIIRNFFFFSLLYQTVFVLLFSGYIHGIFLEYCVTLRMPGADNCDPTDLYITMGFTLLAMNVMLMLKELFQIRHSWRTYVLEWENYLQWAIIIGVFYCVQPAYDTSIRQFVISWQRHVAAVSIFLAWVELMMIVARFPTFGVYVQMFTTVSINFFKFICAYFCLLIAFTLCFGVIFSNYPAFQGIELAFYKVIMMMSGELEYEDVFFVEGQPRKNHIDYVAYLVFVILVTIVLSNLMVGLAVNDIQGLQKSANLDRLVRQVRLMAHLENMLFSKLLSWVPPKIMRFLHKRALLLKSQRDFTLDVRPNDPRENKIPKNLVQKAFQLAVSKKATRSRSLKRNGYGQKSYYTKTNLTRKESRNISELECELVKEISQLIKQKFEASSTKNNNN